MILCAGELVTVTAPAGHPRLGDLAYLSLRTLTVEMRAEIERHGTHTDPSTVPGLDANDAVDELTLS